MLVAPPLQPKVMGSFPDTGCMVPKPFAAGKSQSYLEFCAITSDLHYPEYFIPTVALEPSIERVVRADHLTVGRTSSHMVL
jgi:hypothetical protein